MSLEFYKLLHLMGIILVVISLGGMLVHAMNGGLKTTNKFRRGLAISHGTGLLLALVGGFGLLARLGFAQAFPVWAMVKLVIWVVLGGVVALIYRKPAMARGLWSIIIMVTVFAAFLGIFKPF